MSILLETALCICGKTLRNQISRSGVALSKGTYLFRTSDQCVVSSNQLLKGLISLHCCVVSLTVKINFHLPEANLNEFWVSGSKTTWLVEKEHVG
jgi:hypothetical protein